VKESLTYQLSLAAGRAEGFVEGFAEGALAEAKKLLRLQGDRAFGPPDDRTAAALEAFSDLARVEALFDRLPTASDWHDLLPHPGRREGRR
jgi:hypothetical protein